jgi:hypothetical protein
MMAAKVSDPDAAPSRPEIQWPSSQFGASAQVASSSGNDGTMRASHDQMQVEAVSIIRPA